MSRAAVAKHISGLRELGFALEASPRRGYSLSSWPDRLEPEALAPLVSTRALGRSHLHLGSCGSTNAEAFAAALSGAPHGHLVTADRQDAGRGRRGRTWHSAPMEGLYFSLVLRPSLPPQRVAPLTLACAVALAEAIESETGLSPLLKWPNDLLLGDRKLSGILLELRADPERVDFVVAGIGLNVSQSSFPDDLAATSLLMETGRPSLRPRILASLLGSLERWIDRFVTEGPAPVIAAFRARAALLGSPVTIHGVSETIEGLYEDIDETGALLLRDSSGALLPILAGDVSLRGPSK